MTFFVSAMVSRGTITVEFLSMESLLSFENEKYTTAVRNLEDALAALEPVMR